MVYPYISFLCKHNIYTSPGSLVYHTTGKPFKAFDFFVCFSIHLGTSKQQTQDPVLSFLATQIPPSRTSSRTCRKLSTALSTSWWNLKVHKSLRRTLPSVQCRNPEAPKRLRPYSKNWQSRATSLPKLSIHPLPLLQWDNSLPHQQKVKGHLAQLWLQSWDWDHSSLDWRWAQCFVRLVPMIGPLIARMSWSLMGKKRTLIWTILPHVHCTSLDSY